MYQFLFLNWDYLYLVTYLAPDFFWLGLLSFGLFCLEHHHVDFVFHAFHNVYLFAENWCPFNKSSLTAVVCFVDLSLSFLLEFFKCLNILLTIFLVSFLRDTVFFDGAAPVNNVNFHLRLGRNAIAQSFIRLQYFRRN